MLNTKTRLGGDYQLLLEEPGFAPFEVERDGRPMAYTGKQIKRAADSIAKTEIAPGETITSQFNLCENYDLGSNLTGVRARYQTYWQLDIGLEEVTSRWA